MKRLLPFPSRRTVLGMGVGLMAGIFAIGSSQANAKPANKTEAGQSSPGAKPLKIVLHVSDPDAWPAAFSNVKNLTTQHPEIKLRVISDGGGVYLMQGDTGLAPLFQQYSALGVEFQACHNALNEKQISPSSLASSIQVVPSGVVAIAESQAAGYAYIKP